MAEINYDYYTGADIYNDGNIEQSLLDFYRGHAALPEDNDVLFYLTTHIRENILNWYPFSQSGTVLEIGCGCGTLTDLLCRNCAEVYCVEGSKRRANITYERNKSHDNLHVYAGEFGKFDIDKKFDYVIMIGVFEYAKRFFGNSSDPVREFLKQIKAVLKSAGKILLAIENRYGLKYWGGADEDHLGKPYVGLCNYENYDVQTFGMQELKMLCQEMGWNKYKFYYPFPDYKLPEVIYTDEHLPNKEDIELLPIYLYGNQANFDIRKTYHGLCENSQFGFFSNSFLLECGTSECELGNVIYSKELSYRNAPYRTITVETKEHTFQKIAGTDAATSHLCTIHNNHIKLAEKGIRTVETKFEGKDKLLIETAKGIKLTELFYRYAAENNYAAFNGELSKLWEYYKAISIYDYLHAPASSELWDLYHEKTDVLKLSIIDGNVANIIVDECGEYILIDQEWVEEKQLPAEYLMFYSILHICNICNISPEDFLKVYSITDEKQAAFKKITEDFYEKTKVVNVDVCKRQKDLNWIWKETLTSNIIDTCPVCYFNTGNGFNEEQKIYGSYNNEGEFWTAEFKVPTDTLNIRIDPALCGEKCLYFTTLLINDKAMKCTEHNIIDWDGKKLLNKRNPYVVLEQVESSFKLKINIKKLTFEEIENYFSFLNN